MDTITVPTLSISCLSSVAEYLNFGDIKTARLVCKEWCEELSTPLLFQSAIINISGDLDHLHQTNETVAEQFAYLLNNSRVVHLVRSVCLRNVSIPNDFPNEFWQKYGHQIDSLKFQCVIFEDYDYLETVLSSCKNLEELSFHKCIGNRIDDMERQMDFNLPKLQSISFVKCNFSSFLYHQLAINVGPLKRAEFDDCFVRRTASSRFPSRDVDILELRPSAGEPYNSLGRQFLEHHYESLSCLVLYSCSLDISELISLLETDGLCLKEFELKTYHERIGFAAFETLKRCQQQIERISIDRIAFLGDASSLINVQECFTNLKALKLVLSFLGAQVIYHLFAPEFDNLQELELNAPHDEVPIVNSTLMELIDYNFRRNYNVLKLCGLPSMPTFGDLGLFVPPANPLNLTTLALSDCAFVDDEFVQNIIKWMPRLQHLDLSISRNLSDAGLTGTDDGCLPFSNLKGLRFLNLKECSEISDVTLLDAIKFQELNFLDLSNCKLISDEGISVLSKQNPSLETLKVRGCARLSDTGLIEFLEYAPRLGVLNVLGCSLLTIASIEAMTHFCPLMRMATINSLTDRDNVFCSLKSGLPRCAIATKDPFVFCSRLNHMTAIMDDVLFPADEAGEFNPAEDLYEPEFPFPFAFGDVEDFPVFEVVDFDVGHNDED